VSAPQSAINPTATQAIKNKEGVIAALAASEEVLKIPIPMTNPTTIIVKSKRPNLFFGVMQ